MLLLITGSPASGKTLLLESFLKQESKETYLSSLDKHFFEFVPDDWHLLENSVIAFDDNDYEQFNDDDLLDSFKTLNDRKSKVYIVAQSPKFLPNALRQFVKQHFHILSINDDLKNVLVFPNYIELPQNFYSYQATITELLK